MVDPNPGAVNRPQQPGRLRRLAAHEIRRRAAHEAAVSTLARLQACRTHRETFLVMLELGFWPIGLYPKGVPLTNRGKLAEGKEPFGLKWGLERWTAERWDNAARRHSDLGVGICLGPGRGPGGTWLMDIEGDGPEAEGSRAKLYGGEVVEGLRWGSVRGGHQPLIADGERLAEIIPGLRDFEVKKTSPGVYKPPSLPGLELRLGGYKPGDERTIKQLQSAIPPTLGTDGTPRTWTGGEEIATVPEAFYVLLGSLQAPSRAAPKRPTPRPRPRPGVGTSDDEKWALKALVDETTELACTAPDGRNIRLNLAAFKLGQLVPHYLSRSTVEQELRTACVENKLSLDPGEVEATILSGITAGMGHPRYREERSPAPTRYDAPGPAVSGPKLAVVVPDDGGDDPGGDREDEEQPLPRFANYTPETVTDEDGRQRLRPVAHLARRIHAERENIAPGWPKAVRNRLFVAQGPADDPRPYYLPSSTPFFAWLDGQSQVDWTKGAKFVTQERFFEFEKTHVASYESIEILPHVPRFDKAYYMHPELPPPSGRLETLLDKFLPLTPVDRHLITALIMTPIWGGPPGSRPAFLITGADNEEGQGRGLGKSTLVDLIAGGLYGGAIAVKPSDDMDKVKTRMLSEEGSTKRFARLDNVKTLKFSWSDLEDMITASSISGHTLYIGEGVRRNDLVWTITLNGASLSKDMAQRVVTIKLARPDEDRGRSWREDVLGFMMEHRWSILGDAAAILASPPGPLRPITRWASWEHQVLSKLPMASECQRVLVDRQDGMDEGNFERDLIRNALVDLIRADHLDPNASVLFIESQKMAEIVSAAMRESYATCKATNFVKGLGIRELGSEKFRGRRGWMWRGLGTSGELPDDFAPHVPGASSVARHGRG